MIKLKLKPNTESFSKRITDIYIYAMLFLFPLFTGFHGYAEITLSKYLFFVSVTALWLITLFVIAIKGKINPSANKLALAEILVLLYLVFCCVSAVFSSFKSSVLLGEGRFDGLATTLLCIGVFFGVSLFSRPKKAYIHAAALAVSLNCIVAVLQLLGYNPLHLFPGDYNFYDAETQFSSTFFGTIGNADLFSVYICLMLSVSAVYYISAEKRSFSILPCILLSAFCQLKSGVSGGFLALGVTALIAAPFVITNGEKLRRALEIALTILASAIFAFTVNITEVVSGVTVDFYLSKIASALLVLAAFVTVLRLMLGKREFKEKTLRIFFSVLSVVVFASGLLIAYYWQGPYGTVYELSQLMHGRIKDSFGSSRILIWKKTIELVPNHLLLGGGPGTLSLRLDVNFSRFVAETGKTLSTTVDNAHNEYLGILVNTGLLSLIAYLSAQFVSLFNAIKSAKLSEFCGCFACALLCYWVQAFFGLGLFLVSPIMWLFWGLLISSFRREKATVVVDIEPVQD